MPYGKAQGGWPGSSVDGLGARPDTPAPAGSLGTAAQGVGDQLMSEANPDDPRAAGVEVAQPGA